MADGVRDLLTTGKCGIEKEELNKVVYENSEIRMKNIRNRTSQKQPQEEK